MSPPIKTRWENSITCIRACADASNRPEIQCLSPRYTGLRGGLETRFEGPAFEGGVVVLGGDDGYV